MAAGFAHMLPVVGLDALKKKAGTFLLDTFTVRLGTKPNELVC